jgi:hypothetical protein
MSALIYKLYYEDKITAEVCGMLLDQLVKSKERRRYY